MWYNIYSKCIAKNEFARKTLPLMVFSARCLVGLWNGHFIFGLSIVLCLVKEMVTNGLTGTNVIFIIARVVFQKIEGWIMVVVGKRKSHYSSHNCFFPRLNDDQTHLAHDIAASGQVIFCQQYLNEEGTDGIRPTLWDAAAACHTYTPSGS